MPPEIDSPRSVSDEDDLEELMDQIRFIDGNIKEYNDAIKAYKEERRDIMHRIVTRKYTRDQIIALTQSSDVKRIENCEVVIYDGNVHFESYYWLTQFKILIKAKIPVGHSFLLERDIPPATECRNWVLLSEFVTFELFNL